MEVSSQLRYDPDDGQPHASEQSHLPRLAHHEEQEEAKTCRVPHDKTQFLTQCLAHIVGISGNAGHQFT